MKYSKIHEIVSKKIQSNFFESLSNYDGFSQK